MKPIRTLVADPPWPYRDRLPGPARGAATHYGLLTLDDIKAFPLPALADDARLFLWTTGNFLRSAFDVMEAWGFRDTGAQFVWHKIGRMGMGHRVRVEHEYVLIGERGRPPVLAHDVRSVVTAPRGEHSEKPEQLYQSIARLSPGPYVELFARAQRAGWQCYGDALAVSAPPVSQVLA